MSEPYAQREMRRTPGDVRVMAQGLAALIVAGAMAALLHAVNHAFPNDPDKVTKVAALMLGLLVLLPAAGYLLVRRGSANPYRLAFLMFIGVGVSLGSLYLYEASFHVFFPADILIWSEGDFVNDILKFRLGYPLYTAQENNESFCYPPGAQVVTYYLARLLGDGDGASVPHYRLVQLGFTVLATLIAAACCQRVLLFSEADPGERKGPSAWGGLWTPFLFLMATNSITNPFVHHLHNDALAQLISVAAYGLLLEYARARHVRVLAAMAVVPALGLLVKQSLVIWAGLYGAYLLLFDRPRSLARVAGFAAGAAGGLAAVVGVGHSLWGEPFWYWFFTVLGSHPVSPLRSLDHVLQAWAYFSIGLLGGYLLLRGQAGGRLLGLWLVWLLLLGIEAYTSGVAWMLNHLGPGCLLAGVWFLAALSRHWPAQPRLQSSDRLTVWFRVAAGVAATCLLFAGLGAVHKPLPPFPDEAYAYARAIEQQFQSRDPSKVLLDVGTWVYVPAGVIMKDRSPSIGERGYNEVGDFSGILARVRGRHYERILVRNYHSEDFWYDHSSWRHSSGIRQALQENYREIDRIPGVPGTKRHLFREISILAPLSGDT